MASDADRGVVFDERVGVSFGFNDAELVGLNGADNARRAAPERIATDEFLESAPAEFLDVLRKKFPHIGEVGREGQVVDVAAVKGVEDAFFGGHGGNDRGSGLRRQVARGTRASTRQSSTLSSAS